MPEGSEGQAPGTTGNAGDGGNGDGNGNTGKDGQPFDPARAQATIDKLRPFERQAKDQARTIEQMQTKLTELENAKLSDVEKMQNRLAELEAAQTDWQRERQEFLTGGVVTAAAQKAGALHPDAVWKLVDIADLSFDDSGHPTQRSVDDAVGKIRNDYPTLFRDRPAGNGDGGARGGASGTGDMNSILRRAAGRA